MAFIAEDAGTPVGLLSSTRRASEALGLPFYSCWESLLNNGIVGGMISDGFQQGEAAGKLALQILRGADPDNLPVVRNGTSRAMIDYEQLERFRIPERRLPRSSIVINRPPTLYERYPGTFWAFVTAIAALAVLLAVSWLYIVSQQRLKRGLRQSEERLSLALAAAASGIWEYYPKTRKAYYDTRWYTMLGYEPGALPPEYGSWADLLHPDDKVRTEQAIQRYVDEGQDFTLEFRLRCRDGRWLWISSSGKIVERDSSGSAHRIVGTHVDISERKRTQAELEQANQNLERRVGERTRELAALNEFAAVVSRSLDLGEVMESALQKTMEAAGAEAGAAFVLEEPSRTMVLEAHRGLSPRFISFISRLPLDTALAGKPPDAEHPVVWPMADYPEGDLKNRILGEGLQQVIGVPVTAKERLLGTLILGFRTSAPDEPRRVRPVRGHRPAGRPGGGERPPVRARAGQARGSGTPPGRGRRPAGDPGSAQLQPAAAGNPGLHHHADLPGHRQRCRFAAAEGISRRPVHHPVFLRAGCRVCLGHPVLGDQGGSGKSPGDGGADRAGRRGGHAGLADAGTEAGVRAGKEGDRAHAEPRVSELSCPCR